MTTVIIYDKNTKINFRKIYNEYDELLSKIGIKLNPKRKVRGLGVGEQQIIMIARLLRSESRIIIIDKPTTSFDV